MYTNISAFDFNENVQIMSVVHKLKSMIGLEVFRQVFRHFPALHSSFKMTDKNKTFFSEILSTGSFERRLVSMLTCELVSTPATYCAALLD